MNKQVGGFIIAHSKAVYLSDTLDRVILHGHTPYLTWAELEIIRRCNNDVAASSFDTIGSENLDFSIDLSRQTQKKSPLPKIFWRSRLMKTKLSQR